MRIKPVIGVHGGETSRVGVWGTMWPISLPTIQIPSVPLSSKKSEGDTEGIELLFPNECCRLVL
jgi:hypothetical protein